MISSAVMIETARGKGVTEIEAFILYPRWLEAI